MHAVGGVSETGDERVKRGSQEQTELGTDAQRMDRDTETPQLPHRYRKLSYVYLPEICPSTFANLASSPA